MKNKHIPIRMCVVCKERFPKNELKKFVLTDKGILFDYYQKLPGRGFYLCNKKDCERIFLKSKFQKRLKQKLFRG